jgi:hypothetical protein
VRRIVQDTEIPERTVKRKLAWLEEQGWLEREHERTEGGHFGRTFYKLRLGAAPEATVAHDRGPLHAGARARPSLALTVKKQPPPVAPPIEQALTRLTEHGRPMLHRNGVARLGPSGLVVDKKVVDYQDLILAEEVLASFNEQTGSNPPFSSTGWVKKIVMRIREHPELGLDEHVEVIRRALADPWWSGPASPAVVYGNDTQFEKSLVSNGTTKRKRRYGTGVTAGEMGDLARQLREAGR